jgi:L-seryl-tRNA(Ser) seleniumtransferase
VLSALARGREVLISRGELIEIGGGFRVPDVLLQSGATLREVGTTNRTRVADYGAALSERTALILRVHPSNFRMDGFTERPSLADLASLARRHGVVLAEDLGSGYLSAVGPGGLAALADEPSARESVGSGADLVCFSGDKLLGGPQAGIIVGRHELVTTIRRHPLMRALRVDKLTYIALETTLAAWVRGTSSRDVPIARMIAMTPAQVAARAERVAAQLAGLPRVRVASCDGFSTIGGGSTPGSQLPTTLIALEGSEWTADRLAARLRTGEPPIIARIDNDRVVLDLRTVKEEDDTTLIAAIRKIGEGD